MSNKYIPIETSEFHRDPEPEHLTAIEKLRKHHEEQRRRSIDEAYNPKYYQAQKAKKAAAALAAKVGNTPSKPAPVVSDEEKDHAAALNELGDIEVKAAKHPQKMQKLKDLENAAIDLDTKGDINAAGDAWNQYYSHKKDLQDDGLLATMKQNIQAKKAKDYFANKQSGTAYKFTPSPSVPTLSPEDKVHQDALDTFNTIEAKGKLHPDKIARLKSLYNKYEVLDSSDPAGDKANAAYEEWAQYKKTLHDNGILPTLKQKMAKNNAVSHFAEKKKVADIVGHTPAFSSTPAAPAKKSPDSAIVHMLTKLDELRTKMTNSGYSKEHTAAYDKEKAKLSALGYLPKPVPGQNWVSAYHHQLNGTTPSPAGNGFTTPASMAPVQTPKGSSESDPDPDDYEHLDTKLAGHYPKHEKGYDSHIHKYTRSSANLNEAMRAGTKDHTHTSVKNLHTELSGHAAPETFHVYTGVPYSPHELHKKHFGVENTDKTSIKVHTKAFTSTSIRKHIAKGFAKVVIGPDGKRVKHVLRIKIPKDSAHGKYVAHESNYPHEKEFILNHGKNLNIHPVPEIKKVGGGQWSSDIEVHYWDATIEPDNTPNKVAAAAKAKKAHPAATAPTSVPAPVVHAAAPAHFNPSAPAHSAAPALGTKHKAEAVKAEYQKNPNASAHAIAKSVAAHGQMTYANAYYLANKLKKAHAG